ncbi:MAG: translation initiation factor IF-2 N-terminal domain-containing protein, partial [Planctomycetota bacterium]
MAATRVYILARELGVKSSAIVKKCQDEGLEVKNHMTAISAGLAATIREWFSEGENVTTVETAEKVVLSEVRVRRRPRRKKVDAADEAGVSVGETAQAVAEPATETESEERLDQADEFAGVEVAEQEQETEAPAVAVAEQQTPEMGGAGTVVVEEAPAEEPTPEPEPIVPAGPMLEKPKPAVLSGPQVVRVEAPEPLDRPRAKSRPRHERKVTEPLMQGGKASDDDGAAGGTKRGGKRHKDRTHGRRRVESEEEAAKRSKSRVRWRQRDI